MRPEGSRPIAVALSGGGDSLALTLIADRWARARARDLLILTVDHGLRAESAGWTARCAAIAHRLDRPFKALAWIGDKPARGAPAAARRARQALLADAARDARAAVVLMGHTADDLAEAAAMRTAGSTVPAPKAWAPSPAWPEGRGVFLLRPLLDARRTDIRAWLEARGETWIDDPSNEDLRFARARARRTRPAPIARSGPTPLALADEVVERAGVFHVPRNALRAASPEDVMRLTGLAAVCAGGGARAPARERNHRLATALRTTAPVLATLAGARIEAGDTTVAFMREAGEFQRGGLAAIQAPGVWDGRFEIDGEGEVRRLHGVASRLPRDQRAALREILPAARGALPARIGPDGGVTCPALTGTPSLVGARFQAAAGRIQREPA
ncbi:tRNA lysidine(34) synthetase TilS [Phenylobacterium sp.]|uniref:tRNA lysidine(34) synthetase TilS n=1 Tax=Phenylobacterium sp. TaxID=1871053 RepID=UPI00301E0005